MTPARIAVSNLTCRFKGIFLLNDISFSLAEGRILSLIGPNGSGKSTLLKVMAGVVPDQTFQISGRVDVDGVDVLHAKQALRAKQAVYLGPDLHTEFPLTAQEIVEMGGARVQEAMKSCECWDLRARLVRSLSSGERQRVALARAWAQNPKVLFLDEALSQLDLNHQRIAGAVLKAWAESGKSIILVSHDLSLSLAWATDVLFLNRGRVLAAGATQEVVTEGHLELLYPGSRVRVDHEGACPPRITFQK